MSNRITLAEARRLGLKLDAPRKPGTLIPGVTQTFEPGKYTARIEAWHPVKLNEIIGYRFDKGGRKAKDARVIADAFAGVPLATEKRRVTLTIILGPRQHGGDPDCYFKSCLDGLVKCGALLNDSPAWVELAPVQYERGAEMSTVITLEDLP